MTFSQFPIPAEVVNGYLWDTMKKIDPSLIKTYKNLIPFFPVSDASSGNKSWENKAYFVYDRMMKKNRTPFYEIKNDNILYYLKGDEIQTMQWGAATQFILDRMDDAAQDINEWNRSLENPYKIYFHHLYVYEGKSGDMGAASETRTFSVRPHYISKFIIDAEYHFTTTFDSLNI